jgi:DNA-binding response OmpR family regulator
MMGTFQSEYRTRLRLLLAYADAAFASECGRYFRRLGWEAQMVGSADEARLLAGEFRPDVVVIDAELLDAAGWLTTAKFAAAHVVVVADSWSERRREQAQIAGAKHCLCRKDGAEGLALAVLGKATLPQAV